MDYQLLRTSRIFTLLIFLCALDARAALPAFKTPPSGTLRAHFIDVGQGSSVLLEFDCAAALIDTGGETNDNFDSVKQLQTYLDAFFDRRKDLKKTLSLVLITHAHIDHARGLPMVLNNYTVNSYVDNGAETGSGGRQQKAAHAKAKVTSSHIAWQAIKEPQVDEIGGLAIAPNFPGTCSDKIQFHAMWGGLQASGGWTSTVLNDQNDSSVVTQLKFGKTTFLFLGDLEEDVHDAMLKFFCDNATPCSALKADLVHVAHHGSYNGTSPDFVAALSPKAYVISVGPPDREGMWTAVAYGHPRKVAFDMLVADKTLGDRTAPIDVKLAIKAGSNGKEGAGEFVPQLQMKKAIYATGWDGTVVVEADGNGSLQHFYFAGHP